MLDSDERPEPEGSKVWPNGVVRTVTRGADGRKTIVWDYSNDTHKA